MFNKLKMIHTGHKKTIILVITLLCFLGSETYAQNDTTRRQTIEITSSYKPVLRNSVKINLYASPIAADTSRPRMAYNIPAQNLFFAYQPVSLKPRPGGAMSVFQTTVPVLALSA